MGNRTTDTSFVEQGSTSISSRLTMTPRRAPPPVTPGRKENSSRGIGTGTGTGTGTSGIARGRGGGRASTQGARGSGLARPRGRGIR